MFKPANQIEACGRSYTATPNIIIMCVSLTHNKYKWHSKC